MFSFLSNREKASLCVLFPEEKEKLADSCVKTVTEERTTKEVLPDGTLHGKLVQTKYQRPSRVRHYRFGKLHGTLWKYWHHMGKKVVPEIQIEFVDGKKHGVERRWNSYRELLTEKYWNNGMLL
ncbi:putative calcineurin-like phosphoesterase [Insectomime virus]|uniref:Uncharacterized protein n=1 Tax=Tunisvirus fontaine2 TaxID=1421067 RepID=V9SGJ3_9VIRU|nr:hypothetical protein D1R32_gp292 [Tunisvirus fontaine2]AHA45932.1 putative calcineurin-like phosphoesterase [Insectomime virus]AHC55009.1 hypothetical protein TNS_ORF291 [Tunisvirus fontaine2]